VSTLLAELLRAIAGQERLEALATKAAHALAEAEERLDDEASDQRLYEGWGHNQVVAPARLLLFFSRLFATTLPRQCFLCPFLFARLQVKGVTFHFLNDVFLLHLTLEATQSVFERFAFLQSDFSQRNCTPKPVLLDLLVIARQTSKVKHYIGFLPSFSS